MEFLFLLVMGLVVPPLIDRAIKRGHFEWLEEWFREAWFLLLCFLTLYYLSRNEEMALLKGFHEYWKARPYAGYVIVASIGAMLACGFWWLTGRLSVRPETNLGKGLEVPPLLTPDKGLKPGGPLIDVRAYGAGPEVIWAKFSCDELIPYRNDHVVVLAARVTNSMVDLHTDTDIVKSEPFLIPPAGDLEIHMKTPSHFVKKSAEINGGQLSIDIMVLLAPSDGDLSKVTSMIKIHDIGGLELAAKGVHGIDISELLKKHRPKVAENRPLSSFVQLWNIVPVEGKNSIVPEQPMALNVVLENRGPQPSHELYLYFQLTVCPESDETVAIQEFKVKANKIAREGDAISLGIGDMYSQALSVDSLPELTATGILNGSLYIHIFLYFEWKDHQGISGEEYKFVRLDRPKSNQLTEPALIWHPLSGK